MSTTQPTPTLSVAEFERAVERARQGESLVDIRADLVKQGLNEEAADALVRNLQVRAVYEEAIALINQGMTFDQVRRELVEMGLDEKVAAAVISDLQEQVETQQPAADGKGGNGLLKSVGGGLFVCGAVLWIGNLSGIFPTFPFAGFILMAIGGGIWNAGSPR